MVQTEKSVLRTIYARVAESGIIQPTVEVPIAPDVPGEVVHIAIQEGQKVKKGDLLITIQPDDYKAQLEQATAALSTSQAGHLQAKANMSQSRATVMQDSVALIRTKKLFDDKVVSKVDLENAQLKYNVSQSQYEAAKYSVQASYYQVKSSEASRKQARQNLDRTNIYASMDGTVTSLAVELGQRVVGTRQMAGTEILKIADLSSMEVVVEVNENDIVNVNLGDSARVEVDAYPDMIFYGNVTEIAYSATVTLAASTDQVTNFEVKVKIDPRSYQQLAKESQVESPFRPGMTALVEIYTKNVKDAIAVPIQAVTLRKPNAKPQFKDGSSDAQPEQVSQKSGPDESAEPVEVVFIFENGRVKQQAVTTGISDDSHIRIIEGLEADKEVVTGPYTILSKILKDNMEVSVGQMKKGFGNPPPSEN